MAKSHNKKRNIGIIYEQIVHFICEQLMNSNEKTAKEAINIIKESFKENTQLNKEYKLFKALVTTKEVTEHLASRIINEAKNACNYHFDNRKLEIEKSVLIKKLNHKFGKGVIFEKNIDNYREYATIQTLLNEWRKDSHDFELITQYEIKLHESLTSRKKEVVVENKLPKVDNLTFKLMNEMFNKKYNYLLNENQKKLIDAYTKSNTELITEKYAALKESTLSLLNNYINDCTNSTITENFENVYNKINQLDVNINNKDNLHKFLTLAKLNEELSGE